jgi:hypothetical protein
LCCAAATPPPGKKGGLGRLKRNAAAPAEAYTVTVLCRQLIAGVLVSDWMIGQLCALAGQTREQVLDQLSRGLPRQMEDQQARALQAELSGGLHPAAGPGARVVRRAGQPHRATAKARGGTGLRAYRCCVPI